MRYATVLCRDFVAYACRLYEVEDAGCLKLYWGGERVEACAGSLRLASIVALRRSEEGVSFEEVVCPCHVTGQEDYEFDWAVGALMELDGALGIGGIVFREDEWYQVSGVEVERDTPLDAATGMPPPEARLWVVYWQFRTSSRQ